MNHTKGIKYIIAVLLILILCMPAFTGYIIGNGESVLWMFRLEEGVRQTNEQGFTLFLDGETVFERNLGMMAFSSNVMLFPAILLCQSGVSLQFSLVIWIILIQSLCVIGAGFAFTDMFGEGDMGIAMWVLYVTAPYHILVSYWKGDMAEIWQWAWIPLIWWSVTPGREQESKGKKLSRIIVGLLSLTFVGYGEASLYMLCVVMIAGYTLAVRRWENGILLTGSICLCYPVLRFYLSYLLKGEMQGYGLPDAFIQAGGYHFGQLFTSYAFRYFYPGLGLAMILGLVSGVFYLGAGNIREHKELIGTGVTWFFLTILSLSVFPWNLLQHMNGMMYRAIALLESPVLFGGYASIAAALFTARVVEKIKMKQESVLSKVIPLGVVLAAFMNAWYLSNYLVYHFPRSAFGG